MMSGWSSICWCGVKIQESSSVRLTISCRVIYCGLSKACGYTMWEYSVEIKSKIKNVKILARRLELNQLAGTPESGESRGYFPPSLSKGGATEAEVSFHNNTTGHFMVYQHRIKTNSLQLFARPWDQKGFL